MGEYEVTIWPELELGLPIIVYRISTPDRVIRLLQKGPRSKKEYKVIILLEAEIESAVLTPEALVHIENLSAQKLVPQAGR